MQLMVNPEEQHNTSFVAKRSGFVKKASQSAISSGFTEQQHGSAGTIYDK